VENDMERDGGTGYFFHRWHALPLLLGCLLGVLVSLDPFIINIVAKKTDFTIEGANVLKLFPYEFSLLIFIFLFIVFFIKKAFSWISFNIEKSFIVLFILGLQTIALTGKARIDFSELVIVFWLTLFFLKVFVEEKRLKISFLDILNLVFTISIFISITHSNVIFLADSFLTVAKFQMIIFLIVNFIYNRDLLLFFLKCLIVFTFISSIIAIGQEFIYLTLGIPVVGFVEQENMRFLFETTSLGQFLRVPAFFGTYKPFTYFLNTAMLILFNYYLYKRPFPLKKLLMLTIAFFLMFSALLLTFSQDGLLSLLIGLILSLIVWRPYLVIHILCIILTLIVFAYVFDFADDIFDEISKEVRWGEQRIRIQLAREGISGFIHKHPWIGTGPRNPDRYTGHFLQWPTHNAIIMAADAVGVIGLSAFIALLFYSVFNVIKVNIISLADDEKWISRALLWSFVSLLITLQFHPFFLEKFTWLYMALIQASVFVLMNKNLREPTAEDK
jgi:hypothetical protein